MGKSRNDMRRRNLVTRDMIATHRNAVHSDKRKRTLDKLSLKELDNLDPDDYNDSVDDAGNVIVNYTGDADE